MRLLISTAGSDHDDYNGGDDYFFLEGFMKMLATFFQTTNIDAINDPD
jgi:hypothetical protein